MILAHRLVDFAALYVVDVRVCRNASEEVVQSFNSKNQAFSSSALPKVI